MTEDATVGWHHGFNEHEFEQTPGAREGQGSLACCSPCSHQEWTRLSDGTTLAPPQEHRLPYFLLSALCIVPKALLTGLPLT